MKLTILNMRASVLIFLFCFECFPLGEAGNGSKFKGGLGIDVRAGGGHGKNGKEGPKRTLKCMGEEMSPELMRAAISTCENESGGEGAASDKNLCFTSCVWKNLGLVNNDMSFAEDFSPFVAGTFPSAAQEKIMEAMRTCVKNNSWLPMDNNCSSVKNMRACLMRSVMKICQSRSP